MSTQSGTLTLVFTDIEDSAIFSERFDAAFEPTREAHFRLLRAQLEIWHGQEVETAGDSLFAVFGSALDAVRWAVEAQLALLAHPWPLPVGSIRVRMGLHTGVPFTDTDSPRLDYKGRDVNRASRVSSAGHGGQILLSNSTQALLASKLPPDVGLRDMGLHRLKGVGEERLWQLLHPALPAEFPALSTLNPERHNLPTPLTPFIGREREINAWFARLTGQSLTPDTLPPAQTTRLLTLVGFGGMGKTRTALYLAELCVEQFTHGVCWVEMEGAADREDSLLRIAQALRLDISAGRSQEEPLFAYLSSRHLLLTLDNTEGVPGMAALVRELLGKALSIKILVTTRRALEIRGETLVEVRPLSEEDAQRLFVERAHACREDFALTDENAEDVAALCRRLEGVPLALELAAARITGMTPRQMLPRLNERFKLLQSRSPDLPPRQRALRAAIDWSHCLLEPEERAVFAQLGVFTGGFTMEDAEAVCEGVDVFESVMELRRNSFFHAETEPVTQQDRFVMLDSLREYALEQLREQADSADVSRRHADYFLRFAETRAAQMRRPNGARASAEAGSALDNLRTALGWLNAQAQYAECARLALALAPLLHQRGYWTELETTLQTGQNAAQQAGNDARPLQAALSIEMGGLCADMGDVTGARTQAETAVTLYRALNDTAGESAALNLLGLIATEAGNADEARRWLEQALPLCPAGAPTARAKILHNLARLAAKAHDTDEAERLYREALAHFGQAGDKRGQAETLGNLGALAHNAERMDEAKTLYQDSLKLYRELQSAFGIAIMLNNLGELAEQAGNTKAAVAFYVHAERMLRELHSAHARVPAAGLQNLAAQYDTVAWQQLQRDAQQTEWTTLLNSVRRIARRSAD